MILHNELFILLNAMDSYSKVELLALVKTYNKQNDDKIKNADKLKKNEILDICKKYNIISSAAIKQTKIDLKNVSKCDLKKDLEIYFLKQGKQVPKDVVTMKKQEIIEFMELHDIMHHTQELLKQETEKYQHQQLMKTIVVYNIVKYDNVDIARIDDDNIEAYIMDNDLDCNIEDLPQHSVLLHKLYSAYEEFCKNTKQNSSHQDKIKSLPKIINKLHQICTKK